MKVICRKLIHDITGEELRPKFTSLKIGKEYVVLSMVMKKHGALVYLMSEQDNVPTPFHLLGFEIVDQTIPSSWVPTFCEFDYPTLNCLILGPTSWWNDDKFGDDDFAEKLNAHDPEAFRLFLQEAPKIYEEAGCEMPPPDFYDGPSIEPEPDPKVERLKELFGEDWDKWDYLGEEGADQTKGEKS